MKLAELLDQAGRADGDVAAQAAVILGCGKLNRGRPFPQRPQLGDKDVLEGRAVNAHFVDVHSGGLQSLADCRFHLLGIVHQQVEAIAEPLHVQNVDVRCDQSGENGLCLRQVRCAQLEPLRTQLGAELAGRSNAKELALVHECDAMAPFRLVQIRSGHQDGEAFGGEVGKNIPELAPGDGIDAGGRLVEQQDAGLGNQRADQRELLPHAAAELARQPVGEPVHVEHAQILVAALHDFLLGNAAQIAAIANVLRDGQVGIEAEGLGEVSGLRAHLARGAAKDVDAAGGRFHHPGENLKGRGFSRAIRADQAEDFALLHVKVDPADSFDRAIVPGEAAHGNGRQPGTVLFDGGIAIWSGGDHWCAAVFGHLSPCTRTSPSAGMPGLAYPKPAFNCSLMPTTCLTRSLWK